MSVAECTVGTIFLAVAVVVSLMDTCGSLIVSKMITTFGVAGNSVKELTIVSFFARSGCLVILITVDIW
jgi:hypothetical protein